MDIKCIALDLDRTTLNAQGKLSKANEEAIRKAVAKGIHVCIASGRAFDTLPQDVVSIPGIEYAITGGENIYPREIEEFLYKLDGVKDVQVAGIPSKKYGEAVGAFIILQEGVKMHESDVRDFCKNKISRYKIPKYVFFVKEFPMTGSGKIQKFRLKDLGLQLCKEQGIEII